MQVPKMKFYKIYRTNSFNQNNGYVIHKKSTYSD